RTRAAERREATSHARQGEEIATAKREKDRSPPAQCVRTSLPKDQQRCPIRRRLKSQEERRQARGAGKRACHRVSEPGNRGPMRRCRGDAQRKDPRWEYLWTAEHSAQAREMLRAQSEQKAHTGWKRPLSEEASRRAPRESAACKIGKRIRRKHYEGNNQGHIDNERQVTAESRVPGKLAQTRRIKKCVQGNG